MKLILIGIILVILFFLYTILANYGRRQSKVIKNKRQEILERMKMYNQQKASEINPSEKEETVDKN
jgi:Sec-independent protein translocase protein TatA